jgi:hypothetical protein
VSAAAVAVAGDMSDGDLVRPEGVSVGGHRLGRWVIHFPAVVCTNSPSTNSAYAEPVTGTG